MTRGWQIHKLMADMKAIIRVNIAILLSLYIWVSAVKEHRDELNQIIKEIEGE